MKRPAFPEFTSRLLGRAVRRRNRKAANPRWTQGNSAAVRTAETLTEFECLVGRLGVPQERWADSTRIRQWVRKHHNSRYVPELLLKQLGYDMASLEAYCG